MANRFTELFRLPSNLYAADAPVVIAAGALLKDTTTEKILAQIKTLNISDKVIIAYKVSIDCYSINGTLLSSNTNYTYLDLTVVPGEFSGAKTPVYIKDYETRSIAVKVTEVVFEDGSIWANSNDKWDSLPEQQLVEDAFKDVEIVKQYSLEVGNDAKFIPTLKNGIFCCTCGAINSSLNGKCVKCGRKYSELVAILNIESLMNHKDKRIKEELAKQKEQEELARVTSIEKAIKRKKITKLAIVTVLVCAIVAVISNVFVPMIAAKLSLNKELDLLRAAKVRDIVIFGAYEQDNGFSNGKEDIEWVVLAKEDDEILVISKYVLDCQKYNSSEKGITWETCSLRTWMNDTFLRDAFTSVEQSKIITTKVSADSNPKFSTDSGNSTDDKIFLLSTTEVVKYFPSDSEKACEATAYAKKQGVYTNSNNGSLWWLRSPGSFQYNASGINAVGSILYAGRFVNANNYGVRPAMWINLE